jgi:hypothetical protein
MLGIWWRESAVCVGWGRLKSAQILTKIPFWADFSRPPTGNQNDPIHQKTPMSLQDLFGFVRGNA